MDDILGLAVQNIISPPVLFFALGLAAALARSDLAVPTAVAKTLSLYLMMAIGFKGGAGVAAHGLDATLFATIVAGAALSAAIPLIAFRLLQISTGLSRVDAAAVAAHYGSISIVTFIAATEALRSAGIGFEGYMVAVAAVMETPAILVALWLANTAKPTEPEPAVAGGALAIEQDRSELMREVLLNGSVVLLIGAFIVGMLTGEKGLTSVAPFLVDPFKGVLCLFLLDMGVIAGRGLGESGKHLRPSVIGFGLYMPLIGAALGLAAGLLIGLSPGGVAILATLCASASYIAVPAAMRLALPEAKPAIYVTMSLGVTFPFNLIVGIPLYIAVATALT